MTFFLPFFEECHLFILILHSFYLLIMFTTILLEWFANNGRDLPWRHTRDPYAIWLSEIILQQTRIQQGEEYWSRFIRRWPQVEDLAKATEDEVLREWQGLGYYSRARNLLTAARQVVEQGGFPDSVEGLKQLKGVGDYTAAAIGSMAFGVPAAVVDGNVFRVLARCFGIDTPINTTRGKKLFAQLAQSLLPHDCPSTYNQAIMDFGAIQCTPKSPQCLCCPLQENCEAFRTGRVTELPVKERKLKVRERRLTYLYLRCKGWTALRRRPAGDIWQGLWEPVNCEQLEKDSPLHQLLSRATLIRHNVKHVLTHRILLADFYLLETSIRPVLPDEYRWVEEADIDKYALPRLIEILIGLLPEN